MSLASFSPQVADGAPKAVMHHFSNHYYSALGSQSVIPLTLGDKNLLSLPIFHISGYATVMRTLLAGATLQILEAKINSQLLQRQQTTHLSLVCSQLIQLLEDPLFQESSLSIKHLLLGGSSFPKKCLQQTRDRGFTYHLSYGSTEMASQIATSTNNEILTLLPYRKMKLSDKEIMLAGETRFVGYFQQPLIADNEYFASSDLGEINKKEIKIIGRKDRQFISGGENIQPEEIEKVLLTFPGLSQAYVLPIQDALYGQRPIAFIKWKAEEQPETT
ncbi:AMP-binding protein [Psychromonas sp. KJ10-10]|uniref:AMP-binding protein n=1 Tax=Psychromonas sp. KJ10-10 TaxID=3391823 RepID=UPI0039B591C3